jgi:putative ABC transport system permease protein
MNLLEIFRIAWEAVVKNKIRSFLTMLGIIIGVAAVIIMVAISAGTEATIQEGITGLGSDLVFIQSSFSRAGPREGFRPESSGGLVFDDAAAIANGVNGVKAVIVEQASVQKIRAGSVSLDSIDILGSTADFPSVRDMKIASGRYFTEEDVTRKQKVAVLGSTLAEELFGTVNPVGQTITVGSTKLIVIGVLAEKGLVGEVDYDSRLYTPISVVFQKFTFSQFARMMGDRVRMIYVKVDPSVELDSVVTQIQLLLARRHDVSLDALDFTVTTQNEIIKAQGLAWVAGVSLIVGGIGIMNIMLVSVTERTHEIGIRQSIGATPGDIRLQFLTEALLLSIVGGLLGMAAGIGGAWVFGSVSNMRTVIVPESILLAFSSAALVGIFFGYYPANKAAGLDPIEALRYE